MVSSKLNFFGSSGCTKSLKCLYTDSKRAPRRRVKFLQKFAILLLQNLIDTTKTPMLSKPAKKFCCLWLKCVIRKKKLSLSSKNLHVKYVTCSNPSITKKVDGITAEAEEDRRMSKPDAAKKLNIDHIFFLSHFKEVGYKKAPYFGVVRIYAKE